MRSKLTLWRKKTRANWDQEGCSRSSAAVRRDTLNRTHTDGMNCVDRLSSVLFITSNKGAMLLLVRLSARNWQLVCAVLANVMILAVVIHNSHCRFGIHTWLSSLSINQPTDYLIWLWIIRKILPITFFYFFKFIYHFISTLQQLLQRYRDLKAFFIRM